MNDFNSIPQALEDLKRGKMLIVLDDPKRENQGDLILAAEAVTTDKINFLLNHCRGQICVPITQEKANQLELPLMVEPVRNTEKTGVNFTVTVDWKQVTSFGISAKDRTNTIKAIAGPETEPEDLVRPGHIFPLLAKDGGILEREGHTEATIELLKLANLLPTGVLCEILNDEGEVANFTELKEFTRKWDIKMITIPDLIAFVKSLDQVKNKKTVKVIKKITSTLPTKFGKFQLSVYQSTVDNREHAVLSIGDLKEKPILVRIHSQCLTGDTLLSLKCDCREQLHRSMQMISKKGEGIILYLNQEGRGIGLTQKIKAYALQDQGLDTVEANHALNLPNDARDYSIASDILHDLGVSEIILLTNNPDKIEQLEKYGIKIIKRLPLETIPNELNIRYLTIKKQKLGHLLTNVE